jgi:hypothetical protein
MHWWNVEQEITPVSGDRVRSRSPLAENALREGLPAKPSPWGYWIEADGGFTPVGTHGHFFVYKPNFDTFAAGRIRVTAVSLEMTHRVSTNNRVFTASFFTKFVTKSALRSAIDLVSNQDFDSYDISGLVYEDPAMNGAEDPEKFVDPRSRRGLETAQDAIRCLRSFMTSRTVGKNALREGKAHEIDTGWNGVVRMVKVYENPTREQAKALAAKSIQSGLLYLRGIAYRGTRVWVADGAALTHDDLRSEFLPQIRANDPNFTAFEVRNYVMRSVTPTMTDVRLEVILADDYDLQGNRHVANLIQGCKAALSGQTPVVENAQGKVFENASPEIVPEIDEKKLAKAGAAGFDTSKLWYHGTRKQFSSFRLPKRDGIDELGKGVYVTEYVGTANVWAQGSGHILTCVVRKGPLIELSDLPVGQQWYGGAKWEEVYRGYDIHMTKLFGPGSTPDYREFAERINRRQIKLSDCYAALGYIGATHTYSQIRGQAVIWNPKDIMIVGRVSGVDGYVP